MTPEVDKKDVFSNLNGRVFRRFAEDSKGQEAFNVLKTVFEKGEPRWLQVVDKKMQGVVFFEETNYFFEIYLPVDKRG
jgi:hypothetical protein